VSNRRRVLRQPLQSAFAKAGLISFGLWTALLAQPAQGHGARVTHQVIPSVEVQALFDTGKPMAEAQVAVFAPGQPETPWQTGLTDEAGNFRFSPDPDQVGNWEVQVRQAGHGSMATIAVGAAGAVGAVGAAGGGAIARSANPASASALIAPATHSGASPAQIFLMTGLGLWGLLGTGLYFSRRSQPAQPTQPAQPAQSASDPPLPV